MRVNFLYRYYERAHVVSDATSTEKMQKLVQWLQRVRDTQVQSILLYGQMNSDIMVLNKTIRKIQTVNIGG